MRQKSLKQRVCFFNASVILAGLFSPSGGSAKLLKLAKQNQIKGIISEIILDEAVRHANKIGLEKSTVKKLILTIFKSVYPAPQKESVRTSAELVIDEGDAHILASCQETKAEFLVTLDKKHLLILQDKVKSIKILSPKQLLEHLSEQN